MFKREYFMNSLITASTFWKNVIAGNTKRGTEYKKKNTQTFAKYDYQLAFRTNNNIYNNLKISYTKKKSRCV